MGRYRAVYKTVEHVVGNLVEEFLFGTASAFNGTHNHHLAVLIRLVDSTVYNIAKIGQGEFRHNNAEKTGFFTAHIPRGGRRLISELPRYLQYTGREPRVNTFVSIQDPGDRGGRNPREPCNLLDSVVFL